ncbi:MAG: hypothetical protein ACREBR_00150 [bacterium]
MAVLWTLYAHGARAKNNVIGSYEEQLVVFGNYSRRRSKRGRMNKAAFR